MRERAQHSQHGSQAGIISHAQQSPSTDGKNPGYKAGYRTEPGQRVRRRRARVPAPRLVGAGGPRGQKGRRAEGPRRPERQVDILHAFNPDLGLKPGKREP